MIPQHDIGCRDNNARRMTATLPQTEPRENPIFLQRGVTSQKFSTATGGNAAGSRSAGDLVEAGSQAEAALAGQRHETEDAYGETSNPSLPSSSSGTAVTSATWAPIGPFGLSAGGRRIRTLGPPSEGIMQTPRSSPIANSGRRSVENGENADLAPLRDQRRCSPAAVDRPNWPGFAIALARAPGRAEKIAACGQRPSLRRPHRSRARLLAPPSAIDFAILRNPIKRTPGAGRRFRPPSAAMISAGSHLELELCCTRLDPM